MTPVISVPFGAITEIDTEDKSSSKTYVVTFEGVGYSSLLNSISKIRGVSGITYPARFLINLKLSALPVIASYKISS